MSADSIAIQTKDLSKNFGTLNAVRSLNLTIRRGEMFCFVGPDGAGKTTTIRMLCGVTEPSSGRATVLNFDLLRQSEEIKQRIGYLSQKFSLYGDLTIDENIEFFAKIHDVGDYRKRREELLDFTRLAPFRKRLADQLSGGMKQKLALACTLIHTPDLIFLDEPTTGVDPVSRRDFWKILSDLLKTGITIVMSTPYLDEAERCSSVGLMNKGELMVADSPQNLKLLIKKEILEIVCHEARLATSILRQTSAEWEVQTFGDRLNVVVSNAEIEFPVIEQTLTQAHLPISAWRIVRPSLENVFISLLQNLEK